LTQSKRCCKYENEGVELHLGENSDELEEKRARIDEFAQSQKDEQRLEDVETSGETKPAEEWGGF
jgi:hypothetical protein